MNEISHETISESPTTFVNNFTLLLRQHRKMIEANPNAIDGCRVEQRNYLEQVLIGVNDEEKKEITQKFNELAL